MTVPVAPKKLPKDKVFYNCRPKLVYGCGSCVNFGTCQKCPEGQGYCKLVEGYVKMTCGCILWSAVSRPTVRYTILARQVQT